MSQEEEASSNVTSTELRAVLLGWRKSGKTSVINTLLGPDVTVAVSGQCVKKEGRVNGRKFTLVDTPGWWKDCSIRDLPELSKQAIMRSVSLCPPGPHAFLLVIEADLVFMEKYMEPLEQCMELLGDRVWAHTIVLFTGSDKLINMTIDQHIQRGEETLQRLLQKCGNRFHVFDNTNQSNRAQGSELLEKIEEVARQNRGRFFVTDPEVLQDLQGKWEDVQRRATARQTKVQEERSIIKKKASVCHLEELRVVLLGWVMSGKSSVGNSILNQKRFVTGKRTAECVRECGSVAGRNVTVVDTPGWWKFFSPELNPEWVQDKIFGSISKCEFPHVMLLVLPADASFMEEQKRVIEENMSIFGEQIWRYTIVLFTWSDFLGDALIEHHIESEGEALQWLIEKCGNRYHVFDNSKVGDHTQVSELLEKIEEMVAGNCSFQPGVTELYEKKTKPQSSLYDEDQFKDIMKVLKTEWNRRAMKFQENVENICSEVTGPLRERTHSLKHPPELTEKDKSETSETFVSLRKSIQSMYPHNLCSEEEEASDSPKMSESEREVHYPVEKQVTQVNDNLTKQLLTLLEREWNRQETMVMEKVRATLHEADQAREASKEEILRSVAKVLWWFPGCKNEKEPCKDDEPTELFKSERNQISVL
ncbi:GTPase IMAP family member 8 isoform X1 [Astyanax mexicanus]|uniref:GTPase IMAP family member 8 isoform X1 n=1 Tax=Astyanax mexicanus TaxID=7994 RepID=UPI0020CB4D0C|nr:GTPase IMAP family member 8 isoform X1 [Astyanax mexicanus]